MKQFLLFLLFFASLYGCHTNNKGKIFSMNHRTRPDSELKKLVVQYGDTDAYDDLNISYLDYRFEEFLPYALIMANKYDYPQAYYDVYDHLWFWFNSPDSLDIETKKMALNYLQKASYRGHYQAKKILGEFYMEGIYMKKDTLLGKQLIKEAENLP